MGFFLTLLVQIALFVLIELIRPKPEFEDAKPAALGDFRFPTATEDRAVPLLWGTVRIDGPNVVWWGDLVQEPIIEEVKTGLFSSDDVVRGFRYRVSWQQVLGEGPFDVILGADVGEKLSVDFSGSPIPHLGTFIIDDPELFGGDELGSGGYSGEFRFYAGTDDQLADPYLEQFTQEPITGVAPAWRGTAYIVNASAPAYVGNSTSIEPLRIVARALHNTEGLNLGGGLDEVDGGANPANVVYQILTNRKWGRRMDPSEIDVPQFNATAATLHAEGNGFSFYLTRPEELRDLVKRIEEQIDGILLRNPITKLWQLRLIRDDYDVAAIPELNSSNMLELRRFNRSTWEQVASDVRTPFADADDSWKSTSGYAQDMATQRIIGTTSTTVVRHPGVKKGVLANALAWRELRTLSTPMAHGSFLVDRSFYGLLPGDVFAFTNEQLGFVRLPMRITSIDYGDLLRGQIVVEAIQDVFYAAAGSFAPPPATGWDPPIADLTPFVDEVVFEAPRAFTLRDPSTSDPSADLVWAGARRIGPEVSAKIRARVGADPYADAGETFQLFNVGELQAALNVGSSLNLGTLTLVASPDAEGVIASNIRDTVDDVELGTELVNLLLVGGEFLLCRSATTSTGVVILQNVYRAALDSVQESHAAGASVYLLSAGGALTRSSFSVGDAVDVKLVPRAINGTLDENLVTEQTVTMDDRTRKPYPPPLWRLNGTTMDLLDVDINGHDTGTERGVLFDEILRRDFRTVDEVQALTTDAASIFPDFPDLHETSIEVEVRDGSTVLASANNAADTTLREVFVPRADIIAGLGGGSLPGSLTFAVRARHTFLGAQRVSRWAELVATVQDTGP
jgi:hypothetical protein